MSVVADALKRRTVLVCVAKTERGVPMKAVLDKIGVRTILCSSIYEANRLITQEMPHLIVCDALLSDGHAGMIFDRVKQIKMFENLPFIACILKKTPQELEPLKGRKFSGFIMGAFDAKTFVLKVREIFSKMTDVSPYFFDASRACTDNKLSLSLPATAVGRKDDNVVFRSDVELASEASMVCIPDDKAKGPILLKMPSSLSHESKFYNIFPMSRIKGQGLNWIHNLPKVDMGESVSSATGRKVLFFDPNSERSEQYKEVLGGYDIELITVNNLSTAAAIFHRSPEDFSSIFLYEVVSDSSGISWKKAYEESSKANRPPVIIGTTSNGVKSTTDLRYIRKPFGLGVLVETLEASFVNAGELGQSETAGALQVLPVQYQTPGKLLGFDETGGVIELKFPLPVGSRVQVKHPIIDRVLPGETSLRISAVAAPVGSVDIWQIRFECVDAGTSKHKYWEKMSTLLHSIETELKKSNSEALESAA